MNPLLDPVLAPPAYISLILMALAWGLSLPGMKVSLTWVALVFPLGLFIYPVVRTGDPSLGFSALLMCHLCVILYVLAHWENRMPKLGLRVMLSGTSTLFLISLFQIDKALTLMG